MRVLTLHALVDGLFHALEAVAVLLQFLLITGLLVVQASVQACHFFRFDLEFSREVRVSDSLLGVERDLLCENLLFQAETLILGQL